MREHTQAAYALDNTLLLQVLFHQFEIAHQHHVVGEALSNYCGSPKLIYMEPGVSKEFKDEIGTSAEASKAAIYPGEEFPDIGGQRMA